MDRLGFRATPSLTYIDQIPRFNADLENPDGSASGPAGGQDWDGRSSSIADQALRVLTTRYEMANENEDALIRRVRARPDLATAYRQTFGPDIFDEPHDAFRATGSALEAFILEDPSFHPYTSKYDFYSRGLASLTPQETRGMAIFNDTERANCVQCHTAGLGPARGGGTTSGQFSDFFLRNHGTPRNPAIDYRDIGGRDLGLCGPLRTDLSPTKSANNIRYCGMFATSTLRNTATRKVFFHNGVFRSLRDVIEFYITRDITPRRWFHAHDGDLPYDDLPPDIRRNVDRADMPFAAQHPGARPVIAEPQVDDLVAFLKTLTDGYDPKTGKTAP